MCYGTMFSLVCALPPLPPQEIALLCSAGSQVLQRSPTSPVRSRPPFGLGPSRTGLDLSTKTCRRSPGSRDVVSQRARVLRLRRTEPATRVNVAARFAFLRSEWSRRPVATRFSKLNSPAHLYLCLRFQHHLAMSSAGLEARIDSLFSFPVGLFHPLQHAGLSRRSPSCPSFRPGGLRRMRSP